MKKSIIIISLSIFVFSCKEDTSEPKPNPSLFELVSNKNWILIEYTVAPPLFNITDLYKEIDSCQKDDLLNFQKNNFIKRDYGSIKCNMNEERYDSSTIWNISNDSIFNKIPLGNNMFFYDTLYNVKVENNSMSYFFKRKTRTETFIYFQKFKNIE